MAEDRVLMPLCDGELTVRVRKTGCAAGGLSPESWHGGMEV